MDGKSYIGLLFLLLSLASLVVKCYSSSEDDLKTYIVYTGNSRKDETSSLLHCKNLLQQVTVDSEPKSIIYHYKRSFNGFVAKLTKAEADKMVELDGVVSIFPDKKISLLTTKSWDFIGFPQYVERKYYESDVIIGVIDTGIWPESNSFNDEGFSPPPSKWKGICQTYNFTCNNKIIGARYYGISFNDVGSPRDYVGHGTHVASTAAGNIVSQASMLGLGHGTSRGGVPSARIVVYKVCRSSACDASNILSTFDDPIADGVDILSVSIGGEIENHHSIFKDPLSIGFFHAMKNGVLTVFAAVNDGPQPASLDNFSPWSIVVGAGNIERKFVTQVKLGDSNIYEGISVNTFDLSGNMYPIIYAGDAPNTEAGFNGHKSKFCSPNSLNSLLVKGKIVLCKGHIGSQEAFRAGAIGVLTQGQISRDTAFSFPLPGCYLRTKDAKKIHKYIYSTRTPTATIFKTIESENTLALVVASFSGRGPSIVTPDILKPDLIAPGVDIIASWSPVSPPSEVEGDSRKLEFNIVSGTSMACPHVSGAAGYIKSFQPTWSPAAIRSALMTTAKQLSPINNNDAEFAYGAGQINPLKALNPGLIYEASEMDYIIFLCGLGYNKIILQLISGDDISCSNTTNSTTRDLNYPSFALKAPHPQSHISRSFKRMVTNVGSPTSTYRAFLTAPNGLEVSVVPDVLSFSSLGEQQTYVLTINGALGEESIGSASLVWDDGVFHVRSPIIVYDERAEKVETSSNIFVIVAITIGFLLLIAMITLIYIKLYRKRYVNP